MANDIGFGIRISADTAQFVGNVQASKAALRDLRDEAEGTGKSLAATQTAQGNATAKMASEYRVAASSAKVLAESHRGLDNEITKFLASTDKAYRNQLLLDKGNDLLTRGLQAGVLTQRAYDSALANLGERFATTSKKVSEHGHVIEGLGISAGFAARETRALVDELAAGRTNQALGTFTNIAGRIAMVQPVAVASTLAVIGLGAGMAFAAAQSENLDRAIRDAHAGLVATGRAGIESDAELRQMVKTLALLPDVSKSAAEAIVSSFSRAHQLGGDLMKRLVGIVGDFSKATGEEAPKAALKLAAAFEDPFKGAKALDEELNILTPSQRLLIDSFEKTHDILAAQAVLYDALKDRIQGLQREAMTPMQKATQDLKTKWHEMTDTMGDSAPIQAVKDVYGGILALITKAIGKMQTFLNLHDRFFRGVVTFASGAGISAAIGEAGRSTSGANAPAGSSGSPDKTSIDDEVKSAIKLGDAYQSVGEKMADLALKRGAVLQTLGALEEAGRTNSVEYARLKQVYVDLGIAMSELSRPAAQALAAFNTGVAKASLEAQKHDIDTLIQQNQALYSNGLISATRYYDTVAELSRRQVEVQIQMIDVEITAQQQAYKSAAKLQEQLPIAEKLFALSQQRITATKALDQVEVVRGQHAYANAKAEFDYEVKITNQLAEYLKKLKEQRDEDVFQLSIIGQTERAQKIATAERQVRLDAEREINKLLAERALLESQGPIDPAKAQAIQNAIERIKQGLPAAVQSAGDLAGKISDAGLKATALATAFQAVDSAAFETFKRFKDGWRSAAQYAAQQIRDYVVRLLYELTVQRFIIGIFGAGAAGANASPASAAASALLGNAASSFGSSALGSTVAGAGTAIGGTYGAAEGLSMGWASGVAAPTAGYAEAAGAWASGMYDGIAAVLADIPVYGWIALAVLAIAAYFSGRGGGPKVGGSFLGSVNSAGDVTGDLTSTIDRRQYLHDENQADAQARKITEGIAHSYAQALARLGGTSAGVQIGFGFNRDPAGDAPSMAGYVVRDRSGNVVSSHDNRDIGRSDEEFNAAIQLEAERALVAALQISDLPATIAKVISTIDVKNASKEAIEAALNLAQAWGDILNVGQRDVVADAATAFKVASYTALDSLRAQGAALAELAGKFDGSAEQTQVLAQAQLAYRNSLISLLSQIEQVKGELKNMFGQTREKIERTGLTDQQLYERLQAQAQQKFGELQGATDPAQAQRLAKELDSLYNQAFDLLSPEQQQALKGQFLTNLDILDQTANQKLTELAAAIAEESRGPFQVVADKLGEAADRMVEAANKIKDAADVFAGGGGTHTGDVNVYVNGPPTSEAGA